jgi:RNA polymerase sigma factor for flagellar operon FliA
MTDAEEALAMAENLPIVRKMAGRYARSFPMVSEDDLVQEGMIALMTAARRYDPAHGATLLSYAWRLIQQQMRRHIGVNRKTFKIQPKEDHESLDVELSGETSWTLHDVVGVDAEQETACADAEAAAIVSDVVARLPSVQQDVLRMRFGEDMTLAEVGATMGRTRERARQIEAVALGTLRKRLGVADGRAAWYQ